MAGFLGVDLGTTRIKAALFDADGPLLCRTSRPTPTGQTSEGYFYHDPDNLWDMVASAIREVLPGARGVTPEVVGVASMAEAGLLVDRVTGAPRTHVLPWFDARATRQAEEIAREEEPLELFRRSGLHPTFKYGLPKLLWLRDREPDITVGAVWLSVADYVVYRLTGRMVTDPTLAARTFVYRVQEQAWDEEWIHHFGLDPVLFPEVLPSGVPAGTVTSEGAAATGLSREAQVAVAGHDHLCALPAAGIVDPGSVLDSLGTAESVLGVVTQPGEPAAEGWGRREFDSGLTLAPHVLPGRFCWLGGLPAAGGSIEWLRARLAEEPLSYSDLDRLVEEAGEGPTGILYFPYLSGSGAPCHDQRVRAAFLGLNTSHTRGDMMKAVLEGTAFEAESIRRTAARMTQAGIDEFIVVGGGARNRHWMQIKADVSGCCIQLPSLPEATALGAALTAALGSGALSGAGELVRIATTSRDAGTTVEPDAGRHEEYRRIYEAGYLSFQRPLRQQSSWMQFGGMEA